MLQVLCSVAVCIAIEVIIVLHPAMKKGELTRRVMTTSLMITFQLVLSHAHIHHSSYESREDRERECCKVCIVILSSSDPTE